MHKVVVHFSLFLVRELAQLLINRFGQICGLLPDAGTLAAYDLWSLSWRPFFRFNCRQPTRRRQYLIQPRSFFLHDLASPICG